MPKIGKREKPETGVAVETPEQKTTTENLRQAFGQMGEEAAEAEQLHQNGDNGKALEVLSHLPHTGNPRVDKAIAHEQLRQAFGHLDVAKGKEAKAAAKEDVELAKRINQLTNEALQGADTQKLLEVTGLVSEVLRPVPFLGPFAHMFHLRVEKGQAKKGFGKEGQKLTTSEKLKILVGDSFKEVFAIGDLALDTAAGGTGTIGKVARSYRGGMSLIELGRGIKAFKQARREFREGNNDQGGLRSAESGLNFLSLGIGRETTRGIALRSISRLARYAAEKTKSKEEAPPPVAL